MAIYERGYRPYAGTFGTMPGWWIVAREGWSVASKQKGVRWLGLLVLLLASGVCVFLFVNMGVQQLVGEHIKREEVNFSEMSAGLLAQAHWTFYEFSTLLTFFIGIMVGCGLVSDDMRSRALTLYLVRPISRTSYVIGKALVLPAVFFVLGLLPGLMLWFLVGLWQPPGETMSFLAANADVAWRAVDHFLIMAGSVTGLMLLLSSWTPRRGAAMGLGAAFALLGAVLARIGTLLPGILGELGGGLHIVRNAMRDLRVAGAPHRALRWLPSHRAILVITVLLLIVGIFAVAWRARTTEVAE